MQGGYSNPLTGAGTGLDKTEGSFYLPTCFWYKSPLEILAVQSWAIRNYLDFIVDDMFIKWRNFESDTDGVVERFEEAEQKHNVTDKLSKAMRAARQYGNVADPDAQHGGAGRAAAGARTGARGRPLQPARD